MKHIRDIEQDTKPPAKSSADAPFLEQYRDKIKLEGAEMFKDYLPCHYFDYIGGTSTGGYVYLYESGLDID